MIAHITTPLDAPAETIWKLLKRQQTFLFVTRGVLGVTPLGEWPDESYEGAEVRGKLLFFHVVPGWEHVVRIETVDEEEWEILTRERGGFIEVWDHRLKVEKVSAEKCLYTDEIEIEAGRFTPLVWLFAHLFYRYRHARWRSLARVVGGL